jgi:hypothetical protein
MKKYLSEADAAAELQRLEDEHELFSLRVRGFSPWRILRFSVSLALQNIPSKPPRLPKILIIRACFRFLIDVARLPKTQSYAVKSFASALRSKTPAGYDDVYFGSLLKVVPGGVRFYSVNAAGFDDRISAWRGPTVDTTAILVIASLLARILPVRDRDHVYERIALAINGGISSQYFSANRIRRTFSAFWWQSLLFSYLLRYTGVKTVFVADTGERAMLKAARTNNCMFVELQHGVFTQNHPDTLPNKHGLDASDRGLLLPDMIGLYGSYWVNSHKHTLLGYSGRIKSVGASFIEELREQRQTKLTNEDSMRLLVTTQGIAREELINFLREFLHNCSVSFVLDIKLHPMYDISTEIYQEAFSKDARVNIISGAMSPDTYELLTTCNLHLSISSACHYDAIGLQVPTIVLGLPGHELVLNLVLAGEVLLARNGAELADIVANKSWLPVPEFVADKYYQFGFSETLIKWIKRL